MPKITGLSTDTTLNITDLIPTVDKSGTPTTKNIEVQTLIDEIEGNLPQQGWEDFGHSLTSITALGNRSYTAVVSGVNTTGITSVGMRLKLPRSVAAPTQCTSLNGTNQYWSKSSPSGMTFTDDFTVSAWVKPTSYAGSGIVSRYNGTSGWILQMTGNGQIRIQGIGAAASPNEYGESYQSLPLNKWTHVAATLDMSGNASTIYFDGVLVPSSYTQASPGTALVQAGNLEIGSYNGGAFFPGKIAQVAIYSSVLSAATVKASMNQTLTGSETSLVSAYTFNGNGNDLSANANNLTAQNSATASNTDTPFTNSVTGTNITAGTTNFGIITAQTFSTDTTYTIQVPEGETLPTTGGIGTVSYSMQKTPYGFPSKANKWTVESHYRTITAQGSPTLNVWYNIAQAKINIPVGAWEVSNQMTLYADRGSGSDVTVAGTLSTANNSESNKQYTASGQATSNTILSHTMHTQGYEDLSSATDYFFNIRTTTGSMTNIYLATDRGVGILRAKCAYL